MSLFVDSIFTYSLTIVAILSACVYLYVTIHKYSYWKRLGVPQVSPIFPLGNFSTAFLQYEHIGEHLQKLYKTHKEPFIGLYSGFKPLLMVNSPEMVRLVLIKDFQHFHDRGMYIGEKLTDNFHFSI